MKIYIYMDNRMSLQGSSKSQLSTSLQLPQDTNYLQCITSLTLQNKYFKNALKTADTLISNYQRENQALLKQVHDLKDALKNVQRNITFGNYVSPCNTEIVCQNKKNMVQSKSTQTVDRLQIQRLQDNRVVDDLVDKVKYLVQCQQKYQDKIRNLQNQIVMLERHENKKIHKAPNIGLGITDIMLSSTDLSIATQTKRPKNLSELRALHLKMNPKKNINETDSKSMTSKTKTIVSRVFSTDRLTSQSSSLLTPPKNKNDIGYKSGSACRSRR